MAEEPKDQWDATQWHEVKKGETPAPGNLTHLP